MTINEFKKFYIRRYILLEKKFVNTLDYVSLDNENNFNTYSDEYIDLLLDIASEAGVLVEMIAEQFNSNFKEDKKAILKSGDDTDLRYCGFDDIIKHYEDFQKIEVCIENTSLKVKPLEYYDNRPAWWTIHNRVKHVRFNKVGQSLEKEDLDKNKQWYQYANQKYVLYAITALYALEHIAYWKIVEKYNAENQGMEDDIPSFDSMFQITNCHWEGRSTGTKMKLTVSDRTFKIDIPSRNFGTDDVQ